MTDTAPLGRITTAAETIRAELESLASVAASLSPARGPVRVIPATERFDGVEVQVWAENSSLTVLTADGGLHVVTGRIDIDDWHPLSTSDARTLAQALLGAAEKVHDVPTGGAP